MSAVLPGLGQLFNRRRRLAALFLIPSSKDAVGALLAIPIHYYARIDFIGFIAMIDAVGGVDIDVAKTLNARRYDGYGLPTTGFHLEAGRHHLTGAEALAYARIRKGPGETDFTRAARPIPWPTPKPGKSPAPSVAPGS